MTEAVINGLDDLSGFVNRKYEASMDLAHMNIWAAISKLVELIKDKE